MVTIKKIIIKQIDAVYSLAKEQFGGEFWLTKDFIKNSFKRKSINYGAYDGKELVGVIMVDIGIDRPKAWIFFFDVKKEYRGRGIGNMLLNKIERVLPKDYYELFVDFERTDTEAIRFYSHHGFSHAGSIKNWFGRGTVGLLYSIELRKRKNSLKRKHLVNGI